MDTIVTLMKILDTLTAQAEEIQSIIDSLPPEDSTRIPLQVLLNWHSNARIVIETKLGI